MGLASPVRHNVRVKVIPCILSIMTNQLPRALLADIQTALATDDLAAAAVLLGPDDDACTSAATAYYRAVLAYRTGDAMGALKWLSTARRIVESRYWEPTPAADALYRKSLGLLPKPGTPFPPSMEAVMPMLVRVYVIRFEAAVLLELGDEAGAAAKLETLIPAARIGVGSASAEMLK